MRWECWKITHRKVAGPRPSWPAWGRGLALAFGRLDQLQLSMGKL